MFKKLENEEDIKSIFEQGGLQLRLLCPNNPVGLHLEFWEEGEDVLTIWNPGENYQGWINTLHGGIISMLMDEVAGWVINRKLQTTGVTMQLNVKYKKPVMTTDSQITVRGHIASQRRNIVTIHLTLENSKGEVCDEGEAIYFTFGPDKAKEMGFDCCKVEGRLWGKIHFLSFYANLSLSELSTTLTLEKAIRALAHIGVIWKSMPKI